MNEVASNEMVISQEVLSFCVKRVFTCSRPVFPRLQPASESKAKKRTFAEVSHGILQFKENKS